MGNNSHSYDVFISYRRKTGGNDARLLQQALKARGYNVFFDFDSLRDGKFDERILVAIEGAPVFILMLTANSLDNCVNEDDWVRIEIERAIKMGRKIILVQPSDQAFAFPRTLPGTIATIITEQISELNKGTFFEESIERIVHDRFPSDLHKSRDGKVSRALVNSLGSLQSMPGKPTGKTDCMLGGRYRIIRQCGMGDMGTVLLAEDTLLENRNVAIKTIPSELVGNEMLFVRLKQHVEHIMINHPNIATCRSLEFGDDGEVFLVIDYVKGITLGDYIRMKRRCLTEDEVVEMFTPIADAIDFIHLKGIVHGDIKPQTVLITEDDRPYVIDLGLSRVMREMMTRVNRTVFRMEGTIPYQSPEVVYGSGRLTLLSDVYSFSLLVYECLTGQHFSVHQVPRCFAPGFLTGSSESSIDLKNSRILPSLLKGLSADPQLRPASCRVALGLGATMGQDLESGRGQPIAIGSGFARWGRMIGLWMKRVFSGSPTSRIDSKKDGGPQVAAIDYRDLTEAAFEMLQSLYGSGRLDLSCGKQVVVAVDKVVNDTMEKLDTDTFTSYIIEELVNRGCAVIASRDVRATENPVTQRIAPTHALSGKIVQRVIRLDNGDRQIEYYFIMRLAELSSGLQLWQKQHFIGKRTGARLI